MTDKRKGDLYVLSTLPKLHFSNCFKFDIAEVWHQCLGHHQYLVLQMLKNKGLIDVVRTTISQHLCDSCQLRKLSRLPLTCLEHLSTSIFEKIYCDLWGPAPIFLLQTSDIMLVWLMIF